MTIKLFLCYAHQDKKMLAELRNHLAGKQRDGTIEIWCDQDIKAGTERESEIIRQLNIAHIILLLISSDLLASDYCEKQIKRAMERHISGEVSVIPVLLRSCSWQGQPFGKLQPLPYIAVFTTRISHHYRSSSRMALSEDVFRYKTHTSFLYNQNN